MRNSILVIMVLLLNACSGGGFSADPDAAGGDSGSDAGAPTVTAAGGSATAGTSSGGGTAAGQHAGGSASGGSQSAGGSATGSSSTGGVTAGGSTSGGAPSAGAPSCDVDIEKITAELPMQLTWKDFISTNADLCVECRDETCGTVKVISWGLPTHNADGSYTYLPSVELPMFAMNIGVTSNGSCTKTKECGVKLYSLGMTFTIENGAIVAASGSASFQDNMCLQSAHVNTGAMATDLGDELTATARALKIACN